MLLNIIKHQKPNADKIHLYVKDPFESKYQLLINEREKVGIIHEMNPKTLIYYSQAIVDVYNIQKNIIQQRK